MSPFDKLRSLYRFDGRDGPLTGIKKIRAFIVAYAGPALGLAGFGVVWLYAEQDLLPMQFGILSGAAASIVLLLAPVLAIVMPSHVSVGLVLIMSVWTSLTIGALETSGIHSGQITLLAQLPIWATFFFGRKGALSVLGLVLFSFVIMLLVGPTSVLTAETSHTLLIVADGLLAITAASIVLVIVYIQEYLLADLAKQKQEAEKSSAAKTEFLSSMSHELRTPLNSILGFGQLLKTDKEEPLSEDQQDSVEHIVTSGKHLLELINQVLDLSQIESGKLALSMKPVWPSDLFRESLEMVRKSAEEKNVTLSGQKKSDKRIDVDPVRLTQVIVNLLSNAVKYNKDGGEVHFGCVDQDDEVVRLFVEDTGQGIPLELQEGLFEPFNRLGKESSNIEGTGVGLTVTRQLVEAMGGDMGFESRSGEGAIFWADFPACEPARQAGPET